MAMDVYIHAFKRALVFFKCMTCTKTRIDLKAVVSSFYFIPFHDYLYGLWRSNHRMIECMVQFCSSSGKTGPQKRLKIFSFLYY